MKALQAAVVVMGVLIVVGVVVLGITLAHRMSGAPAPIASVVPDPFANVLLDEPAGTRIAGVALAPDRAALRLEGGGPDRVVLIDLRTGRALGHIGLAH